MSEQYNFEKDIDVPSKQIIINEKCPISEKCKEFDNCKIKNILQQLKAKEQECEALGQAYLETNELLEEKTKECTKLKAENDELKYKAEFFENYNNAHINKIAKLEKILTEIKEMCNSVENIENVNSLYDAKLSGMYLQANKILQKISECEGNNDMEN